MSNILPFTGTPIVTVPAAARIACFSEGNYSVVRLREYANGVPSEEVLFNSKGAFTSAVFAIGATIVLRGGDTSPLLYSVGTDAFIIERNQLSQSDPAVLNATGTLTAAAIMGGLITSTTAAAVTATLDTGAVMDAASTFAINDVFFWSFINTGPNAVTLAAAASGHTFVGNTGVASGVSHRYMTRKTAANTFVSYRI